MTTEVGAISFQVQLDLSSIDNEVRQLQARLESKDLSLAPKADTRGIADAINEFERLGQRNFDDLEILRVDPGTRADLDAIESALTSVQQKNAQAAAEAQEFARQAAILRQQYDLTDEEVSAVQAEIARAARETQKLAEQAAKVEFRDAQRQAAALERQIEEARIEAERLARQTAGDNEILRVNPATQRELNAINRAIQSVEAGNRDAARQAAILRQQYGLSESEIRDVERALASARNEAQGLSGAAASFVGNLGARAVEAGFQAITQAIQATVQAIQSATAESLRLAQVQLQVEAALGAVFDSQGEINRQLDFVRQVADQVGGSFTGLSEEYSRFAAAARLAGIDTQDLQDVFAETSRVAATFGATAADQNLILNALSQIASKGVVSMEELRQQLGERLPVAFEATARGLGVTQQELNDLVSSGDLTAREFFPAFAEGLRTIGGDIPPLNQALGEIGNVVDDVGRRFGQALLPIQEAFAVLGAEVLGGLDLEGIFEPLQVAAEELAETLANNPEIIDTLTESFQKFGERAAQGIITVIEAINRLAQNEAAIEGLGNAIENLGSGAEILGNVVAGLLRIIEVSAQFTPAADEIKSGFSGIGEGAVDLAEDVSVADVRLRAIVDTLKAFAVAANNAREAIEGPTTFEGFGEGANAATTALEQFARVASTLEIPAPEIDDSQVLANVTASAKDVFERFKLEQDASLGELLQAREGYLDQVNRLEANGVITAKEAADARVEIEKAANDQIEEARQESLEQFERAINTTIAAIDQGAQSRINAVLQQQAAGNIDENEAARQIAEINDRLTNDTIFAKQREIDKVKALESEKVISAEEAADRISRLQGEIGQLTGQRLQAEIAEQQRLQQVEQQRQEEAKQAALERINAEIEGAQRLSQAQQISQDIASTALANETALLQQGLQLSQARTNLEQARLSSALDLARAEGDVTRAVEIQGQIVAANVDAVQDEFEGKRQLLALTERQTRLEAQRAINAAEVAALEAQIAVERSQVENATAEEVSQLRQISDLRAEQVDTARETAAVQDALLQGQREQLSIEEAISLEKLKQNEVDGARTRLLETQRGIVSALAADLSINNEQAQANLENIRNNLDLARSAGLFQGQGGAIESSVRDVERALRGDDPERQQRRLLELAASSEGDPFTEQILRSSGLGAFADLVGADRDNQQAQAMLTAIEDQTVQITSRLDALIESSLAPRIENLNVTSADPVGDAAGIAADAANLQIQGVNP